MNDRIGIITVLFKSDTVLEDFINCLNKQTHKNFEVLYIENDVENQFCEVYLKEHSKFDYRFVRNEKNVGVAAANNQGIDYFTGKEDANEQLTRQRGLKSDIVYMGGTKKKFH